MNALARGKRSPPSSNATSGVRRWEKERGLPVHRTPGAAGGKVFAYTGELSDWLAVSRSPEVLQTRPASARSELDPDLGNAPAANVLSSAPPSIQQPTIVHRWK